MQINAYHENWPLRESFSISRDSKSNVDVVVVEITAQSCVGKGEAVPYSHYGQNIDETLQCIHEIESSLVGNLSRDSLRQNFPANAARNALDCALWDLEAKISNQPVWKLAKLPEPAAVLGACSLSLESPQKLADSANKWRNFPLLKLKLGPSDVVESVKSVRAARPDSRLIVDANEAWTPSEFKEYLPELATLGVEMIEQPFPAGSDQFLEDIDSSILICADESFHLAEDLDRLHNRYDVFNIKLDKTGGLTEAIELSKKIKSAGKQLMIGSMMATSLSLAPALLLSHDASYIDLDSSIWLKRDRLGGLDFEDGMLSPAQPSLWG